MTIHRVLAKLAPLLPERVQAWRRTLDLADHDIRVLVEKQILRTAHEVLGDFRERLLLSLPPRRTAAGPLNLGTVLYEAAHWPAGISPGELLQNMAVFGRSGAGKTNLTFHLLTQLHKQRIPFLYLDWKRTARRLLPLLGKHVRLATPGRTLLPFRFNPFTPPPGIESAVYANHVVDAMGDAYTLGDAARSVLHTALTRSYATGNTNPSTTDLLHHIEEQPKNERSRGWQASATRALETIGTLALANTTHEQAATVEAVGTTSTIIELDALGAANKSFLVPLLCFWVYATRLAATTREKLSLVIFVEEAHHVLYRREARRESLMELLLRQCREIGIAIVVVDQHPHLISPAALGNTYTSICLNLKDPRDVRAAAALSLMAEDEKHHLSKLPTGEGIVKLQDRWHEPFLIRIPHVLHEKGSITDDVLRAAIRRSGTLSALPATQNPRKTTLADSRVAETALTQDELAFVHDVLGATEDGVNKRYQRLGLSADKGNRLKQSLLSKGVLEEALVSTGKTRRTLLRVTARARQQLGLQSGGTRGSLAHEYWQRWYAAKLEERGYRVVLEASRNSGCVDVLAEKDGLTVAIEIETGKSAVARNVREDVLSGFRMVVVVATTREAERVVERALRGAGLFVPRVVVVQRDEGLEVIARHERAWLKHP